jgi:site-specific recombinase XerD
MSKAFFVNVDAKNATTRCNLALIGTFGYMWSFEDLVLYSAGHTFATDMLDKTGNLSLVQKMLGHESITTTSATCILN